MKILLIGGSGCFGTEFLNLCKEKKNIKLFNFRSKDLNICNYNKLKKKVEKIKPEIIINSSAIVGINQCEEKYNEAFEVNTIGTLNLAKICLSNKIILVQTSTHAVFDGKKKTSYNEKDIPKPNNVYSGSKFLAEKCAQSICDKYYIIRFPTLFGERNNELFGFVDKVIFALKNNKNLKISNDKIDTPTYAKDAALKLLEILEKKKVYGIYHLANTGRVSYYEFVLFIKNKMKSKSKITPVKDKFFKSKGFKPLRTAIVSKKISGMRSWKTAINDYLKIKYNA